MKELHVFVSIVSVIILYDFSFKRIKNFNGFLNILIWFCLV